jgi:hypothetical protein
VASIATVSETKSGSDILTSVPTSKLYIPIPRLSFANMPAGPSSDILGSWSWHVDVAEVSSSFLLHQSPVRG